MKQTKFRIGFLIIIYLAFVSHKIYLLCSKIWRFLLKHLIYCTIWNEFLWLLFDYAIRYSGFRKLYIFIFDIKLRSETVIIEWLISSLFFTFLYSYILWYSRKLGLTLILLLIKIFLMCLHGKTATLLPHIWFRKFTSDPTTQTVVNNIFVFCWLNCTYAYAHVHVPLGIRLLYWPVWFVYTQTGRRAKVEEIGVVECVFTRSFN